uniref:Tensin-3 n=1 Tax=Schistocephalus solidus TaxID=70667 RepID=A0A0X3Q617_SCHSO
MKLANPAQASSNSFLCPHAYGCCSPYVRPQSLPRAKNHNRDCHTGMCEYCWRDSGLSPEPPLPVAQSPVAARSVSCLDETTMPPTEDPFSEDDDDKERGEASDASSLSSCFDSVLSDSGRFPRLPILDQKAPARRPLISTTMETAPSMLSGAPSLPFTVSCASGVSDPSSMPASLRTEYCRRVVRTRRKPPLPPPLPAPMALATRSGSLGYTLTDDSLSYGHGFSCGRSCDEDSGFQTASGLPKRALSTANMMNSQGWSYRNGAASEIHSPLGYPTVRSYTTTTSSTGRQMKSPGYSARRERLRMESEQQEQLTRQQQLNRSRMHIGSSSDLHQQQMQRRQHYHSMSTIQPERRAFEELETITLQPIGKGVQDLDSRMGSTTTLSQPPRAAASSMMEGLNRVDNVYPSQRPRAVKNMTNFGKQASAVDISRQNHSGSTSFLSSRRISGGALSDLGGFKERGSEQTLRASNTVIQQRDAHQTVWTRKSPVTFSGSPTLMQVQETAPAWYRLKISRQEAIAILRHQPPGSFLVRDSTTYKDAYGLAVRVAKSQNHTNQKSDDVNSDLVRHYLIETVTTPTRGVRIKGFSVEPIFASLVHLIYEHTRTPLALPCCLVLPAQPTGSSAGFSMPPPPPPVALLGLGTADSDAGTVVLAEGAVASGDTTANNGHPKALNGSTGRNPDFAHSPSQTASSSAASGFGLGGNGGLRQPSPARNITSPLSPTAGLFASELTTPGPNFFCRCLYLGFVDVEWSLGETAVERAVDSLIPETILESVTCDQLGAESPVQYTECQLQVSPQEGILLTDLNRKIFFQRHLSSPSIVFVGVDPRDKMFLHPNHAVLGFQKPRLFGVVIKKLSGEHVCHVFSEFDSNHSAFSIVSQINALLSDNK